MGYCKKTFTPDCHFREVGACISFRLLMPHLVGEVYIVLDIMVKGFSPPPLVLCLCEPEYFWEVEKEWSTEPLFCKSVQCM